MSETKALPLDVASLRNWTRKLCMMVAELHLHVGYREADGVYRNLYRALYDVPDEEIVLELEDIACLADGLCEVLKGEANPRLWTWSEREDKDAQ